MTKVDEKVAEAVTVISEWFMDLKGRNHLCVQDKAEGGCIEGAIS